MADISRNSSRNEGKIEKLNSLNGIICKIQPTIYKYKSKTKYLNQAQCIIFVLFFCKIVDLDMRPMSPEHRILGLSRIDETNELVGLNDRLTNILGRNQLLETKNKILSKKVNL